MEDPGPLILEISSDEEAGFGSTRKESGYGGGFGDGEDCEWLSKLLVKMGEKTDDSDDVVFVSEVLPRTPNKSRSDFLKPSAKVALDDDCVVLDGDPDKPLVVVNSKVDGGDDSDDLEIVGEKGEVACRDFPHPRHLCAKFLFASTPHEAHCGQCHCFVCDSLAPCPQWGNGISSIDHCHASDKEEYWKAERKRVKKADKPVPVISSTKGNSVLEPFFPTTQVPALARPPPSSLVQDKGFSAVTTHPDLMTSNVSLPNAINQSRIHPSGYAVPRYRPQPQIVSHSTSNNNVASRDRSRHLGNRTPQTSPHPVLKRHGSVGASPNSRLPDGSQLSRGSSLKRCRAFQTPNVDERAVSNQQHVESHTTDSVIPQPKLSSPYSMNVRHAKYLPSRPRMHSWPYSSYPSRNPKQHQSKTPARPYASRTFPRAQSREPFVSSQPSVGNTNNLALQSHLFQPNNPAPSQAVSSNKSAAGNALENQLHSRSLIYSHPNVGNKIENHSSQPQAYRDPTSLFIDGHSDAGWGNQTQNGVDVSPMDFNFFPDSSIDNGNLHIRAEESQYQSTAPAETSELHAVPINDHHPSIAPVNNFHRQDVALADFFSPIDDADCQFPESRGPDPLDFQFDNLTFDKQSLPGAVDASVTHDWNVFSPEPAFIDTSTLFDI